MRTKYLFLSCLFFTFLLFLPGALAQNYSQWSLPEGATTRIGKGVITDIAYSPDGSQLAVASLIGIWIYDARTGEELDLLTRDSPIYSVAYSPDGRTLAAAGGTEVYLWDTDTGKYKTTLIAATKDMFFTISSIAYSPDGTTLATAGGTAAYLWDADTGEHQATLIEHARGVNSLMYSPDGKTIATASYDGTTLLWNTDILASQISQQPSVSIGAEALRGYVKQIGKDTVYRVQSIVGRDPRQDLALIKVSGVSSPVLSIGRSGKVQVGESVYVAGNPMGFLEGTFSNGIVSGVREFRVGSQRIQITAPISEGSSGGPVLNSKGEVIGIAVSTITAGQNLNFAIPSGYLSELLNKVKDQEVVTDNPFQEVGTLQTPQQIAKSALASTVLIVIEDTSGQILSTGSGFFVAPGIIATNLHVVKK